MSVFLSSYFQRQRIAQHFHCPTLKSKERAQDICVYQTTVAFKCDASVGGIVSNLVPSLASKSKITPSPLIHSSGARPLASNKSTYRNPALLTQMQARSRKYPGHVSASASKLRYNCKLCHFAIELFKKKGKMPFRNLIGGPIRRSYLLRYNRIHRFYFFHSHCTPGCSHGSKSCKTWRT